MKLRLPHSRTLYSAALVLCLNAVPAVACAEVMDREIVHLRTGQPVRQPRAPQGAARHGAKCSMSRKRDCWDNAVAESCFASLRKELTNRVTFLTRDAARTQVFEYIEGFYNRARRHSTINYQSPVNFELSASKAHAA